MPTDPGPRANAIFVGGWGGVSYPLRWMVVLTLVPSRNKVPHLAAEYGCYLSSCCGLSSPLRRGAAKRRGGLMPTAPFVGAGGVAPRATGGGELSPEALTKGGLSRVTPPLSLRRSTINVENVVVRLWQSSTICLRANARSAFLFTGSPRSFHSLAMTKGTKCSSPHHSCHSRAGGNRVY